MRHSYLYGGAIFLACGIGYVSGLALLSNTQSRALFFVVEMDLAFIAVATILFLASNSSARSSELKTRLAKKEADAGPEAERPPTPKFQALSMNLVGGGSKGDLSLLELTLLQELRRSKKKSDEELSSITGVDKSIISAKLDKLYEQDYITREGRLTERSFNLLHDSSQSPAAAVVGEPKTELDEITKTKARLYELEQLKQDGKIGEHAYAKLKDEYEKKMSQADKGTQVY